MALDPIRIDVVRTGGFGGLSRSGSVDARELPADEAAALVAALDTLDLDALAAVPSSAATTTRPDAFHYDMTVSRGARRWRLALADPDIPSALRPIIRRALQSPG